MQLNWVLSSTRSKQDYQGAQTLKGQRARTGSGEKWACRLEIQRAIFLVVLQNTVMHDDRDTIQKVGPQVGAGREALLTADISRPLRAIIGALLTAFDTEMNAIDTVAVEVGVGREAPPTAMIAMDMVAVGVGVGRGAPPHVVGMHVL